MAYFEIQDSCEIGNNVITVEQISDMLQRSLNNHYSESSVQVTSNGVTVEGDLKGSLEHAMTKATIDISIVGNQVLFRAHGNVSFGTALGCFLIVLSLFGVGLLIIGLFVAIYLTCNGKPKGYFEDAIRTVKYELRNVEDKHYVQTSAQTERKRACSI